MKRLVSLLLLGLVFTSVLEANTTEQYKEDVEYPFWRDVLDLGFLGGAVAGTLFLNDLAFGKSKDTYGVRIAANVGITAIIANSSIPTFSRVYRRIGDAIFPTGFSNRKKKLIEKYSKYHDSTILLSEEEQKEKDQKLEEFLATLSSE